ncbi:tryptophan-rich sensory protein [Kaistia sp. 32K]|uniref:TspO/MBR family protein n=1 Tax=Kaistia sp. 32K TaxID=2795690 RepID=UPI0019150C77|nr:TspO/MBR family protein [Kaistia sp. 32K]BCP55323.1 tryptophan-rich sensory protein [Kaistia sp. 32K]
MSSISADTGRPQSWLAPGSLIRLAICLVVCFAAAVLGSWMTLPSIPTWYAGLQKPFFNPPNWIFGPVWTLLYALMAVAFWRVWVLGRGPALQAAALAFAVQLVLNVAWSGLFFGLHAPGLALIDIAALLLAIIATMSAFSRIDSRSAWMLAPYLAWVAFASVLNASIWWLN